MIKLLRGQSQKIEVKERLKLAKDKQGAEFSLSFEVNVVDSALQTRLQDLAQYSYTQEGKQRYVSCVLNNCIADDEITINDAKMKASELAKMADYSDPTTISVLAVVCREVDKCVFVSDEEAKK